MNILLIDDDKALSEALIMYFEGFQHSLYSALLPSEGFRLLEELSPDLLLLDVMLPEQDGFSVCRDIRASRKSYSDIPIIIFSM